MLRRYRVHILASKGRFFKAGEEIPDDVSVAQGAEKYRIRDDEQQPDESESSKSATSLERDEAD